MLPASIEDNDAGFIADNSLEEDTQSGNGNLETETNTPENDNSDNSDAGIMEDLDETTNSTSEQLDQDAANVGDGEMVEEEFNGDDIIAENDEHHLTIENNEETEANDNSNESTQVDDATERYTEFKSENVEIEADDVTNLNIDDKSDEDEEDVASNAMHSNYETKRNREDISSDDENNSDADEMSPEFNSEWSSLAEDLANKNDKNNDLSNDIDAFEPVPVDLSNDIAVNNIAAAQDNYPINPDAEFIDVDSVVKSSTMPRFEKLSLTPAHAVK